MAARHKAKIETSDGMRTQGLGKVVTRGVSAR